MAPGDDGGGRATDPAGSEASATATATASSGGTLSAESSGDPPVTTSGPGTTSGPTTGTATDTGEPPGEAELEGYGTLSTFGEGGVVCTVTNLDDTGPGSLNDCITNRDTDDDNPTPVRVEFEVGGVIPIQTDIRVRQPYVTVDGLTAPEPGITLEKSGDGTSGQFIINTWSANGTCGHDVLVQGIRFRGVWTRDTEDHSQNAATIALDGEDFPLCLRNVVLNRVTVVDAQDSGGDIWGSAQDVTVQYSAFLYSLHPNTISHFPGGETDQQRERLSNHHNLYAYIHERGPQVRGDNRDHNYEQNVMHRWAAFGFGGGYAMRLRCRDGVCPQRLNVAHNHFTGGGANPEAALILGEVAGADADETTIAPEVFMDGNWLPPENADAGTAAAAFDRPEEAEVTIYEDTELVDVVLPRIGAPYRTAEEDQLFEEVATQITEDLN